MFHWKGGVLGGLSIVAGWVIAHADPISALLPQQYAGSVGTVVGLVGTVIAMLSEKVGSPKQIVDVIPPASPSK